MKYESRRCWCGKNIEDMYPTRKTCSREHYKIWEEMISGESLEEYTQRKALQIKNKLR